MSTLIDKIRSRGYWQVVVRPVRFNSERISDIASLRPILQKAYVSLGGRDFPLLVNRFDLQHLGIDWIGQQFDVHHRIGSWRFYQSGQFICISGMPIDWRDQSDYWPANDKWRPGTLLGVGDTIFTFTQVFEFASRLALSDAGDEEIHIAVTVGNLKERALYMDIGGKWPFLEVYRASIEKFPYSVELTRSDLVAKPRDLALQAANELFKRFGWGTTIDILRDWQSEMIR